MKKLESLKGKKFDRQEMNTVKGGHSGLENSIESIGDCTTLNMTKVRSTGEVKRDQDIDDSDWAC
ncbi:hypothetical protein CHRY9390_01523 [Chryseobacterium aquaeductus]|uniref:Uncharacterized protein n=1 Tax=Chryseobacterium aquaeductus TaxID=2675056 RepID=A0A9N8QRY3_9FLAO|nr:hypothetical protein [Chryseobacterium aquaeductus]CAA7330850.1 hypothetical protein CHRY9390_01523 [Chryseobacterium potabilaquae]CAD7806523.1 hypothetical protein CHRY9390_01523 [Chryseobacterium aquaeductus]